MALGVENVCNGHEEGQYSTGLKLTVIQRDVIRVIKSEIKVLEDLREEEALRVVNESATVRVVDIINAGISVVDSQHPVETVQCTLRAIQILRVPCRAECIEIRLENFRSQNVVGAGDIKAMLLVESQICGTWSITTSEVTILGNILLGENCEQTSVVEKIRPTAKTSGPIPVLSIGIHQQSDQTSEGILTQ